jgi:transcription antitermination factor NusG
MENWYVLYTKPRYEKKVAAKLTALGIEAYCPMLTTKHQWSDRKKVVSTPLISSCIFIHSNENDRGNVFQVPGVVRYLFWLGKPAIVRDSEIETMQNWLSAPNDYEVSVDRWKKGDNVILESGPFVTQSALVQEVNPNHYVLILESLGCVLKVKKKSDDGIS